jgi:hypothetical protein
MAGVFTKAIRSEVMSRIRGRGNQMPRRRICRTAASLAPVIVWLAPAVKVERPFALRLHLDCARFAGEGRRLGMHAWSVHVGFKTGVIIALPGA